MASFSRGAPLISIAIPLIAARLVKPRCCSLGDARGFDGDDIYAQFSLEVDPPEVMTQAHRIVELVKQHCR